MGHFAIQMILLQFSTSHYCRKARLALGYKGIAYQVENLTPGVHTLKLRPLTGMTTVPVLLPEPGRAIADSTHIFQYLEAQQPEPSFIFTDEALALQMWLLEDWLDESIGTATRFVYYDFRAKDGKSLDASLASQAVIQIVRKQYGMNAARVTLAADRLTKGLDILAERWQSSPYLVGDRLSVADLTAAALLSPLARLPHYREGYPWLFERIRQVHELCHEPLPPGLEA